MSERNIEALKDKDIFSGLKGGNITSSIELLYDRYFRETIDLVKFMGGNEEDGADVFQEVVLVLIEKIKEDKFRQESSIKTFLFSITRNVWLMELRTRERRKKREVHYTSGESTIQQMGLLNKSSSDIHVVFNRLGDICKRILIGFYFENKSMNVLLKEFDFKNEQVLRNRKHTCMRKLKEILSENQELLQSLKSDFIYE